MHFSKLEVETRDAVAILRLNEPAKLNAISIAMIEEINAALDVLVPKSRALLITGVGPAFCAGADLAGGMSSGTQGDQIDFGAVLESHVNPLMQRLHDLPIPWISAVRGPAAGVGCSLALAADIILASETGYFLQAFSRIGLVPDGGSTHLLTRAIGRVRASEMMLLAQKIPAGQALDWGLINRVLADAELDEAALALAAQLAQGPTQSLGMIRQLTWAALDHDWDSALNAERAAQRRTGATADPYEGIAAFRAKRPAKFQGK